MNKKTIYGWMMPYGYWAVVLEEDIDSCEVKPLDPRLDLRNHSPTGFAVGTEDSGSEQLALAIMAEIIGDKLALKYYQLFKQSYVARWGDTFRISGGTVWSFCDHMEGKGE